MRWPLQCLGRLLWLLSTALAVQGHDIHQSTAEIEFNPKTNRLEVSLTVFVDDLELALMRQAERELSLTQEPAARVNDEIVRFLARCFVVKDEAGKAAGLIWTGRQIDAATANSADPAVTLYFEILLPGGLNGATLTHTVFCDRYADQVNLVHLRTESHSTELLHTKNMPTKRLMVTE